MLERFHKAQKKPQPESPARTRQALEARLIARAWTDSTFKARLLADPQAAIRALGYELPGALQVTVLEETKHQFLLRLPVKPQGAEAAPLEELQARAADDEQNPFLSDPSQSS